MQTTKMHTLAHSLINIHVDVLKVEIYVPCHKVFQKPNDISLFLLRLLYADKVYSKLSQRVANNCSVNVAIYP